MGIREFDLWGLISGGVRRMWRELPRGVGLAGAGRGV